jgi:hypothetical protein
VQPNGRSANDFPGVFRGSIEGLPFLDKLMLTLVGASILGAVLQAELLPDILPSSKLSMS